jgi:flagellar protein FlaG
MDISSTKAVAPVPVVLPVKSDRTLPTATGAMQPAAVSPVAKPPERVPVAHLEAITQQLQDYLRSSDRDVEFRVDVDTGTQVITVRDGATGDIVRQFPGEEVLRAFKNMNAGRGTLLDMKI